ncbi:MAG: hypothetical protein EBS32_06485 [Actinobacteria bacterium]|jgi:phosphatidylcholine synthase|nr:hypothetical protein [Actinomycetota bacterium]
MTRQRRIGMTIHVLTASGAIAGLVALQNVVDGNIRAGLIWLIVCQVLDGIDGPIARRYGASEHASTIDGHVLDLVVDYVTCVVVPAVLLVQTHLVPRSTTMAIAGLILLTGALWFAKTDQETEDSWFNGFPAGWNIVIPSFLILHASQRTVTILTLFFCALQMTNVQFPHIMKAPAMRKLTLFFTVLYFGSFIWLSVRYPNGPQWARTMLVVTPAYLGLLVIWRTWFPHRKILGKSVTAK